jgi:hypothetical protein
MTANRESVKPERSSQRRRARQRGLEHALCSLMTLSPEERFAERLAESGRERAELESFIRKPKT